MIIMDYFIVSLILIWFIVAFQYIICIKKQGKSICCGSCRSCCKDCRICSKGKTGVELNENTGSGGKLS